MELIQNKIPDFWKTKLETDTNISNIDEYILDIISEANIHSNEKYKVFALNYFNIDIENETVINGKKVDLEKLLQTTLKIKNEINNLSKNTIFSVYINSAPNMDRADKVSHLRRMKVSIAK
ncbi:MAG: hypothetical protein AUK33_10540 [Flavobacteriaceae bacterium CG2_30_34_30]|nr:hypothetical protein [Flavobacteriia bacterium]OIP49396.1 MAG: hypothetical protein AUK33_10540 [Flavobacteriaceae bacterium CG2_30_34_30]PJC06380.1 MAG: hypothetical protein CO068_11545 [Flavobacteriaceae bacterium CG_4_9_14_0_8_um_filter_34_30]